MMGGLCYLFSVVCFLRIKFRFFLGFVGFGFGGVFWVFVSFVVDIFRLYLVSFYIFGCFGCEFLGVALGLRFVISNVVFFGFVFCRDRRLVFFGV